MPYILASILQPIFGWISDKYGHRSQLLLVASVLYVSAHNMLLVLRVDHNPIIVPVCALVLLGVAYALFTSVIWACYAFVVDDRVLTIAYDDSHTYEKVEWYVFINYVYIIGCEFVLFDATGCTNRIQTDFTKYTRLRESKFHRHRFG
eukprot:336917_1